MTRGSPLFRQRTSLLYNYGPGKVFFNEKTRFIEQIVRLGQDSKSPDARLNRQQLVERLRAEAQNYAACDLEPQLFETSPIHLTQPDYALSTPYPLAFYCPQCGHLYLHSGGVRTAPGEDAAEAIARTRPANCRCTCQATTCANSSSPGRVIQYDVLTTHNCGEEIFVPLSPRVKCPRHGYTHLHWLRQNSERAARWQIVCLIPDCGFAKPARDSFYGRHYGCPLEPVAGVGTDGETELRLDYSSAPFMKATHYVAKVIHLLNSDDSLSEVIGGQRAAAIAGLGCLRDAQSFRDFEAASGFESWTRSFRDQATPGLEPDLEELGLQRDAVEQWMPASPAKTSLMADLGSRIANLGRTSGPALPLGEVLDLSRRSGYARQIRDTALYMDRERGWALQELIDDADSDPLHRATLESALRLLPELHISELRYEERIPVTTALIGFTRGTYRPRETKLNLYSRREAKDGIDVYVSQSYTEGLWVQLDPSATLAWLNRETGQAQPVTGSFPQDLLALQKSFDPTAQGLFGEFGDSWTQKHFGLLHTVSHLFVKAGGRLSGLEQEGIGEELLPYTNSFLVYANHSGDFVLGGLMLLMEHHISTILSALKEDAHRCVYNPACEEKNSACHGCVHVSEISCAHFNRTLGRRLLVGPHGFWS